MKFKVGDKVRIQKTWSVPDTTNRTYTIERMDDSSYYLTGGFGGRWTFCNENKTLELVEEKVEPKTATELILKDQEQQTREYINQMCKDLLFFGTPYITNSTLSSFINQPKKSIMQKLSSLPMAIIREFSKEQKALYQAGYTDQHGKWTKEARDEAYLEITKKYLDDNKAEFVDRANEVIALEKEEKECC